MRVIPYRRVSDLDALLRELLAENRLESGESRACFVVPSHRDRGWWRIRAGLSDFGLDPEPRLWNWEDIYNDLSAFFESPLLRQIDPPDHRLILSHIVAGFLKERGPELLELWPGLARPGFIDVLSDDIRELINEAVSAGQLAVTEDGTKPTSAVLPRLYARYLEYLKANALLDSAQLPLAALELLENAEPAAAKDWAGGKNFVFVGFMSFTHGQLALLRKLEELCREGVTVLKPATDLPDFQDATQQLQDITWEDDPPEAPGRVAALTAPDDSLEPELIARSLALWSAGEGFLSSQLPFPGFGAIGMSVPERRTAAMEASLRRYRVPCSPARGRSIAQTLLGTLIGPLWAAWVQNLEPRETALLLSCPCLAGPALSVEDAARAGPRGVKGWEAYLNYRAERADADVDKDPDEKKEARRALKAFKALTRFCRALEKGVSPAGLMDALSAFLNAPGLWADALAGLPHPDLDGSLRELSASAAEVEAKDLALCELQPDLGPAGKIILKGGEAVDFLRNWCEETLVQPHPPMGGAVILYSGPPPILASHPVWIMTDVTQKNWPGVLRSSPLLDAPERDALALASAYLPSIHDKHVQKEALFRRLLQTGDELTVTSRSSVDEDGRPASAPLFMSSFLADTKGWSLAEAPATILASDEYYFPAIEVMESDWRERAMPAARNPGGPLLRLPVSGLYELLDCPLRYWLKRSAKLRERAAPLFSEAEAGGLTHKIWEAVWRRWEERVPLPQRAAEEWENALALREDYAPFERLLRDRRLERHRKNIGFYVTRLARLQQDVLDRLAALGIRHEAVRTEAELPSAEVDGVVFTGRCDRLEILRGGSYPGGCAVIVDYKWGKSASYEKKLADLAERRYLSTEYESFAHGLQLSAYALMYAEKSDSSVAGVGFLGHRDGKAAGTFGPSVGECYLPEKKIALSPADRAEEAREAMRCAAAILKSNRYEPCYAAESCRYCDMKGICRKGELRGDALVEDEE